MKAKIIFNHLLVRTLGLVSERLKLLIEQRHYIQKWADEPQNKVRYTHLVRSNIDGLLRNRDVVSDVLQGLGESKPKILNPEQEKTVRTIKQMFKWTVAEYKAVQELASEVRFDQSVFGELEKNQSMEQPGIEKETP